MQRCRSAAKSLGWLYGWNQKMAYVSSCDNERGFNRRYNLRKIIRFTTEINRVTFNTTRNLDLNTNVDACESVETTNMAIVQKINVGMNKC